ncbi:uncharacterized protein LOC106158822 [Lingula anatina]|uniref:Uncharacterized protein LOC106158822 n=1 Tax=Lingula anatina TaxID=7574 RepID=A0A1S3HXU3_LINAN|nr:uncharacterized protein LOC106158822 [Lingula anatina]|eukprot:XP_013390381.1 uncharacterized protein LOC106158822 [Lingula anatina]
MANLKLIEGTWFPTGYYGHFRSKSRNDYINEFRYLAKPSPPKKFIKRSGENVARHVFSHHDNREAFLNDALYFEQGLGRRRVKTPYVSTFKPDLITWMPHKKELDRSEPHVSTYKLNYNVHANAREQLFIKRPKSSFDPDFKATTTYRYAHGKDNPNRDTLCAMNNQILLTTGQRQLRPHTAKARESVASCMSWNVAPTTTRRIPQATATYPPATCTPASTQVSLPGATTVVQ